MDNRTMIILIVSGAVILDIIVIAYIVALLRKKTSVRMENILAELRENVIIQPQQVNYRGSRSDYGRVKNGGLLALTATNLIFIPYGGRKEIIIPLTSIADMEESNTFYGSANIRKAMIVKTIDSNEIAFITQQNAEWIENIKKRIS